MTCRRALGCEWKKREIYGPCARHTTKDFAHDYYREVNSEGQKSDCNLPTRRLSVRTAAARDACPLLGRPPLLVRAACAAAANRAVGQLARARRRTPVGGAAASVQCVRSVSRPLPARLPRHEQQQGDGRSASAPRRRRRRCRCGDGSGPRGQHRARAVTSGVGVRPMGFPPERRAVYRGDSALDGAGPEATPLPRGVGTRAAAPARAAEPARAAPAAHADRRCGRGQV